MDDVKAIIFDFDDTLMATYESRLAALVKTASDFGIALDHQKIQQYWGRPFNELIHTLIPSVSYGTFLDRYSKVMKTYPPRPLPGASDLLIMLNKYKIKVFVLSSGSRELVRQDLKDADFLQYVNKLWGFEDTEYYKPDPRVLAPVLSEIEKVGIRIHQSAFIGDSISDFLVAHNKGMLFFAVLSGFNNRKDFHSMGLEDGYIVNTLYELTNSSIFLPLLRPNKITNSF